MIQTQTITTPPSWTTSTYTFSGLSEDIEDKTDFLLKIWRDIHFNGNDSSEEKRDLSRKILSNLINLVDQVFPEYDLELDVPEVEEKPFEYNVIKYEVPELKGCTNAYQTQMEYHQQAVKEQLEHEEKQKFVNYLLEVLKVAEANRKIDYFEQARCYQGSN